MDHAIDSLRPFYEVTLDQFVEEHKKGNFSKLSENPYYEELKALNDAMNILRKYMDWDTYRLSEQIRFRLEE